MFNKPTSEAYGVHKLIIFGTSLVEHRTTYFKSQLGESRQDTTRNGQPHKSQFAKKSPRT